MRYQHFDELQSLLGQKLITARPHPTLPLTIYNYTAAATGLAISDWSEALSDCRGLILENGTGKIVGRPFPKFWGIERVCNQLPAGQPTIYEKVDGSLGIACNYNGQLVCATRGSFESAQAKKMREIMAVKHPTFLPFIEDTWLFEIIYPENRVVVDYGNEKKLVLLDVLANATAQSIMHFCGIQNELKYYNFQQAKKYDATLDFNRINEDPQFAGEEGFVCVWPNGFRAKVKLAEYRRLHKLMYSVSTRSIWEMLMSGQSTNELLLRVPAEFYKWVTTIVAELTTAHNKLMTQAELKFLTIVHGGAGKFIDLNDRKAFAEEAKKWDHPGLLFALYDYKDISKACWELVEPKWSKPFSSNTDGEE